ncbi:MAG TPA: hypothetical protein VFR66_10830 [Burkholderiales bacterium]|nr:hypothetical protein [Burkholderiales bacterium]
MEALVVVLLVALPWWWLVHRELAKLTDARYLRAHGIVIVSERALQARSAPIGEYMGHPIWGSVRFMDMEYRFDHVLDRKAREQLAPRELFLEPGLVYVTD